MVRIVLFSGNKIFFLGTYVEKIFLFTLWLQKIKYFMQACLEKRYVECSIKYMFIPEVEQWLLHLKIETLRNQLTTELPYYSLAQLQQDYSSPQHTCILDDSKVKSTRNTN